MSSYLIGIKFIFLELIDMIISYAISLLLNLNARSSRSDSAIVKGNDFNVALPFSTVALRDRLGGNQVAPDTTSSTRDATLPFFGPL